MLVVGDVAHPTAFFDHIQAPENFGIRQELDDDDSREQAQLSGKEQSHQQSCRNGDHPQVAAVQQHGVAGIAAGAHNVETEAVNEAERRQGTQNKGQKRCLRLQLGCNAEELRQEDAQQEAKKHAAHAGHTDKRQKLLEIDQQIAALHATRPATFYFALGCELCARIISSAEILIFLHLFGVTVNFADCILILGFTSLFANALFFLPMQLGAREGGFAMAAGGLMLTAGVGISLALLIRLRELVCVIIGLALMKVGNSNRQKLGYYLFLTITLVRFYGK